MVVHRYTAVVSGGNLVDLLVCVCVHVCMYVCMYVRMYVHTHIHIQTYPYICICTHTYAIVCICIYKHIHMYTYIYIYSYVYIHIHVGGCGWIHGAGERGQLRGPCEQGPVQRHEHPTVRRFRRPDGIKEAYYTTKRGLLHY